MRIGQRAVFWSEKEVADFVDAAKSRRSGGGDL
jgi:predicted DNA-binding transcriptional regulator AlpA